MKSALVILAACAVARAKEPGPVAKVVSLLQEMQARIEQDGEEEQAVFDKFACWCEKTTSKKADDITSAKAELKQLGAKILELKATVATSSAEIVSLTKDIQKNEEAQKEATAIREKEHASFLAEKAELEEAITALEKAIIVLGEATKPAFLAEAASGVNHVIEHVSLRQDSGISPEKLSLIRNFMKAAEKGRYTPQSATIQGILKDMYDSFSSTLEDETKAEGTASMHFEDLMAVKAEQLKTLQETLQKTEERKAEAETQLADAAEAFADTEAQLKADIEFFEATKASCEAKGSEWGERKALREQELKGIAEALSILTSDEAKEIFGKAMDDGEKSFLQAGSWARSKPVLQALKSMQQTARRVHSVRLAALAAELRNSKVGHFDKVIEAIDKVIDTIKQEGKADDEKLDKCKDQLQDINSKVGDLTWKIENNKAKAEKLQQLVDKKEAEHAETVTAIESTEKEIKDMEDQRHEENGKFLAAKSDDEEAIKLLEQAKAALSKYYADNKIELGPLNDAGLLQARAAAPAAATPEPMPDATFSKKGSRKLESKGIIGILATIIEDLQQEIKDGIKAEEGAQIAFEKSVKAAKKLVSDLAVKKTNLEETVAEKNQDIDDEHKIQDENEQSKQDQEKLEADIKPDCDWIAAHIGERREKRANEMEALAAAKDYLAGMQPDAALAQVSHGFDDDALPSIGFSTVSFLQRRL